MLPPSAWVLRFAPRIREGGSVLDVAAGSGRHSRALLDLGHRVTAVDLDVSKLQGWSGDPRLELVEADLEEHDWPFGDRRFDGIVVTNYLHRALLPQLAESLRPGGVLIYETFGVGHEAYGRPTNPDYLLKENELLDVYEGSLTVVAYEHVRTSEPRPAVVQRLCAVLPGQPTKAP